tara:strand:- start:104 stop:445 length:342 start_codon:yes stop_codon:yes gene_type:complete
MKNRLFIIYLISTLFSNVSYASFPTNNSFIIIEDTLKKETTLEYHQRMESMGFDIENCQCTDCQKFKGVKEKRNERPRTFTNTLLNIGIFIIISILLLIFYMIWMFISWVNSL